MLLLLQMQGLIKQFAVQLQFLLTQIMLQMVVGQVARELLLQTEILLMQLIRLLQVK